MDLEFKLKGPKLDADYNIQQNRKISVQIHVLLFGLSENNIISLLYSGRPNDCVGSCRENMNASLVTHPPTPF